MLEPPLSEAYLLGIELFNRGEYFDAHEIWEKPWRATTGTESIFYQALIQAAVALEHYRRGNRKSAATVWMNCQSKLSAVPGFFMGMDVRSFWRDVETALKPALTDGAVTQFDPREAPTIRLCNRDP